VVERSGKNGGVIYVVREGLARRTEVELGADNGSLVEVLSALQPEDAVILPSGLPLGDGMRVVVAARAGT
jgi:hypothetical protein